MQFDFSGNDTFVSISGDFTYLDHAAFVAISKRLLATPSQAERLFGTLMPAIVIDMSKLDFIDSAALGMLLAARGEALSRASLFPIL